MGLIIKKSTIVDNGCDVNRQNSVYESVLDYADTNACAFVDENIKTGVSEEVKKILELEEIIAQLKQDNSELSNAYNELTDDYEVKILSKVEEQVMSRVGEIKADLVAESEQTMMELAGIVDTISNCYENELHAHENDIKEIVFASLLKILNKEYGIEYLLSVINESIDSVKSSKSINIFISEADYQAHSEVLNELFNHESVIIKPDGKVKLGGCIVRANEKNLDKRLETQIDIFKNILLDVGDGR